MTQEFMYVINYDLMQITGEPSQVRSSRRLGSLALYK